MMDKKLHLKYFWILAAVCLVSLFLFLGKSDFHTKGEPREAVVAFAMLDMDNWTLPITNGTDMAYKPPMFHWMIAAISTVTGAVTEYTSRMPSAIALAVMVLAGYLFYSRRRGSGVAFLASLIALTNFEVHRAGMNCRVDMLLAAMMVLALFQLYKWGEKGLKGVPLLGILCLSGAFLTKGPVGLVLPCAVVAVFMWIRGMNFFRIFFSFLWVVLAACIIPAFWYYAAWKQGGEQFLALVLEENVLRFLGKMTYSSHENPWPYNVMTVITGFVPYTILLVMSLFTLRYTRIAAKPAQWWNRFRTWIREMDDTRLFSFLSIAIMFVFYCIPKSKRSVYLLPIYPFIAYFIAEYVIWLVKYRPRSVKWFNATLCVLALVLTSIFAAVRCGLVPHTILEGKHADENLAFLNALETIPLGLELLIILLPAAVAAWYFWSRNKGDEKFRKLRLTYTGVAVTVAIFFALDGVYQPAVLNVKSNKPQAARIAEAVPEGTIYSYIANPVKGNRLHHFTLNFYLGNRIVPFIDFAPEDGYVLIGKKQYGIFMEDYGGKYELEPVPGIEFKSNDTKDITNLYKFNLKQL
ncbi:MAG: glycosyltransferase family 39 protein [Bacteroidales bacterium]|nr:glycosyltransferase family 39 protein [Bacteroidales bacterium]